MRVKTEQYSSITLINILLEGENFKVKDVKQVIDLNLGKLKWIWLDVKQDNVNFDKDTAENARNELIDVILDGADVLLLFIGNLKLSLKNVNRLMSKLKTNISLETIDFENVKLGHKKIKSISQGLIENFTLKVLRFYNNGIDCESAKYIGELLKKNSSLKVLSIVNSRIELKGCEYIIEGLECNYTLEKLTISDSLIMGTVLSSLCEQVIGNNKLICLDISDNIFEDDNVKTLTKILQRNDTLIKFKASGLEKYIAKGIKRNFKEVLYQKHRLMELDESYKEISEHHKEQIRDFAVVFLFALNINKDPVAVIDRIGNSRIQNANPWSLGTYLSFLERSLCLDNYSEISLESLSKITLFREKNFFYLKTVFKNLNGFYNLPIEIIMLLTKHLRYDDIKVSEPKGEEDLELSPIGQALEDE